MSPAAGAASNEQTPESIGLKELFHEWVQSMEKDVLQLLKKEGSRSPSEIATALNISEKATLSLICAMAQQGTIRITDVQSAT